MSVTIRHKPDFAKRVELLRRLKLDAVRESVNDIEREILTRYASGTGPATLGVRSGRLRSAPKREIRAIGVQLSGCVFIEGKSWTNPVYAGVHEFGATIRPTRGRFLAIPLAAARSGAAGGVSVGPRDYAGGFFFRSRNGKLLFGMRSGGRVGRLIPLFVMKESVRIPARPVWAVTAANQRPRVMERFRALARAVAQGAA
jgi:phage gpG-like protein